MKHLIILGLFVFIVLFASPHTFAMGGPAPEVPGEGTPAVIQPQTAEAQPAVAGGKLEKVKARLASLEAEHEKTDAYLETLNKKIIKAKTAGDTKKLSELQATERAMADRENKLSQEIKIINEKYPQLRASEEVQGKPKLEEKPKTAGRNIVYHDVVMGDTLMNISRKYFGTPVYYKEIAKMNNIADTGHLTQGSSLMIDLGMGGGKVGTVEAVKKPAPKPSSGNIVYHVVASGDTLMSISRQYFNGSASYYRQIAEMNGLTGASPLRIGMKLKIDKSLKLKPKKPSL